MRHWVIPALCLLPSVVAGQTGPGPFARVTIIRPHPGRNAEFEAGYRRHLAWHRTNRDPWIWYGWSPAFGNQLDLFIDGTFGRSAASLDSSVAPAGDRADNQVNVAPYADFISSAIWEALPEVSGQAIGPPSSPLLELTTYELEPRGRAAFEAAIRTGLATAESGTRWFRLVVGGPSPTYFRMRPRTAVSVGAQAQDDPGDLLAVVRRRVVELFALRPDLSLGLGTEP